MLASDFREYILRGQIAGLQNTAYAYKGACLAYYKQGGKDTEVQSCSLLCTNALPLLYEQKMHGEVGEDHKCTSKHS